MRATKEKEIDFNEKIDDFVASAEALDELRDWKETKEEHEDKELQWKTETSEVNKENFNGLNDIGAGRNI